MASFILRDIDEALWKHVKSKAAAEGVTIKALILRLLTQWVGAAMLALITVACTSPTASTPLPDPPLAAHGTPSTLTLTATAGQGPQSGHAAVTVRVVDAFQAPVPAVSVRLETSIGTLDPVALTTDENGRGAATLSAPAGSVKLTATIANGPTSSTLVAIQQAPTTPDPTPNPPPPGPPSPGALSVTLSASTAQIGYGTTFTATVSGGSPRSVSWSYGDGGTFTGISTTSAHAYGAIGNYAASVTVTDTDGRSASASTTATVTAAPPPPPPPPPPAPSYSVSLSAAPAAVNTGGTSMLTATVTPNNGAPAPTSYTWDCDGNGTTDATTVTNTHPCTYPAVGTFAAKVTATGGTVTGSASTTVTVTVAPPPTLTATLAASASTVAVGDTITFTATVGGLATGEAITAYQWDLDATAGYESTTTANTRTSAPYAMGGIFTAKVLVTTSTGRTVTTTTQYVVTSP